MLWSVLKLLPQLGMWLSITSWWWTIIFVVGQFFLLTLIMPWWTILPLRFSFLCWTMSSASIFSKPNYVCFNYVYVVYWSNIILFLSSINLLSSHIVYIWCLIVYCIGIKMVPGADDGSTEILLRVANFFKDVPISLLSDDNFSEVIST